MNGPMATKNQQSITSLPPSPDEERISRVTRYTIAMAVRMACVIVAILVPDWWRIIPILGAVILPYVAVVVANVSVKPRESEVERPGSIQRYLP